MPCLDAFLETSAMRVSIRPAAVCPRAAAVLQAAAHLSLPLQQPFLQLVHSSNNFAAQLTVCSLLKLLRCLC